ncbi:MAG: hypothetical protein SP1CHLAM54_04990 [Chlamydiia bacterium]|nr:hypothetical protein [Chlamydiia bacterium]MCH9615411.1 hypothetical protein [Chlamydiia bacterium]MCH9628267.1 hypothetical protein [Chlamydiia bacterium]
MRKTILLLGLALVGCYNNDSNHVSKFHDDGRVKPIVAFVPIVDTSGEDFAWSLSDELTQSVYGRIVKRGNFCVIPLTEAKKAAGKTDPFTENIQWIKTAFKGTEFVVFTELVEHNIHAKEGKRSFMDKITPSCKLEMTVRLRVFDNRTDTPHVILQELLQQSHMIPDQGAITEQSSDKWKQKTYTVSPLGFSHYQLSKAIVSRVEDYITIAKSKF